jgi:uncharacterized membrane protein YfcA
MGGGGSILTVPIFVYVLAFEPKLAIAMSLPVVGVTSLVGALGHWRGGNVDLKTAALFGVVAMIAAYAGARLAAFLTGAMQLSLLAVIMLAAAISMFRSARRPPTAQTTTAREDRPASLRLLVPVAVCVGLVTGIVGIGGGFLIVPALVLLARIPMKQAVGTSLLVIAMNCASGFVGYMGRVDIPWMFVLGFTTIAVLGILAGTYLVRYVSQRALKQAFSVFLIAMGTLILVQNRKTFSAAPRASSTR